ncbi:hypothetical protein KBB96_01190 [Luteolibacter ambystomatis]|uniref:Glutamine amidotransferase domain-containing protein n=1 Tax=Luteolibacter ambystomatis TaxID=2824561 RepID=A0A975G8X9_9BACT|nr:hypothetical protein [Luteolibacter ambystomatis]QUE51522.1 hypothetical protein KBB96_01190 [Luteolibacter ambystomatis]
MPFTLSNLHFSPTPVTLVVGVAALLAVIVLAVMSWNRSPHPRRTAFLEGLRVLATLIVVLLLWKPEWLTITHPTTKPRIAILWDDSKSMTTLDATLPPSLSDKAEIVSRAEWVKRALDSSVWKSLEDHGANEVLRQPFATPPADDPAGLAGTDMTTPLENLLEQENNLRAVVMLGDGDYNLGQPPVAAAQKLRLRGIPLFTLPVGSRTRLPDLDLLAVTAPTYGIVGENVQIPFTIRSSLDREIRTVVRLRDETGHERTKNITLAPNTETYDSILWKLEKEGTSTLELSLPVAEGERIEANNSRKFTIAGRPEKIRVLVVESLPRWEYRYLRNALSRDPGVELSCLLFHPDSALGMGEGHDYVKEFPSKLQDLAKYDVIFLGDVGVQSGQLTKEQCELIRGLVENQASGVVFLPGAQGNQFTLLDTALGDLMPVTLDDTKKTGFTDTIPSPLNLTSEGRGSLLTMLGDTEEENPVIWRRLPGFYWHAPVIKAKGGTEVLAVHGNRRGKFGPIPLLVTKTAGNGKVLFMGIDSAWRWRRGVEDLYHYRFWGQVARWMSYQRNMAAGQRVRLFFTPERPAPGDTVTLHANAFDANGAPLQNGNVTVDVTAPDGKAQRLELQPDNNAWGAFSGRFKIETPGAWKLRGAAVGAEDKPVETSILAQGVQLEKTGQPARPEVFEEMAKVARGRMIQPDQINDLIKEVRALPEPRPLENRVPLGSHWAVLTLLILLLAIFWTGRKFSGAF